MRVSLAEDSNGSQYDVLGGAIASLTLGQYQIGALAGASTLGLAQGHVGGLGQLFATARFFDSRYVRRAFLTTFSTVPAVLSMK